MIPRPTLALVSLICMLLVNSPILIAEEHLIDHIPTDTSPEKTERISVLSWNIAMLPLSELFYSSHERAKVIANLLRDKDFDIIVFQEAFSPRARNIIYRELCAIYPNLYGPANSRAGLKINSGLWILSRIPLAVIHEIKFSDCSGFDCLSRKGAILLRGSVNGQLFHLIATHLDSDESTQSIRTKQLNEICDQLISPYSDPGIPQIICGDFNINRDTPAYYKEMLEILGCEDGGLAGDISITFGFPTQSVSYITDTIPRQLDYILIRNSAAIRCIERQVSVLASSWRSNSNSLSDHYGVEAVIEFAPPLSLYDFGQ